MVYVQEDKYVSQLNELREECYRLEERAKMFQEGMLAEQLRRLKLEDALWNLLRDYTTTPQHTR